MVLECELFARWLVRPSETLTTITTRFRPPCVRSPSFPLLREVQHEETRRLTIIFTGPPRALVCCQCGALTLSLQRNDVPDSVKSATNTVDPSSWGTPSASYPSGSSCDINQFFTPQQLVLDISLCGDWYDMDFSTSHSDKGFTVLLGLVWRTFTSRPVVPRARSTRPLAYVTLSHRRSLMVVAHPNGILVPRERHQQRQLLQRLLRNLLHQGVLLPG